MIQLYTREKVIISKQINPKKYQFYGQKCKKIVLGKKTMLLIRVEQFITDQ